MGTHHRRLEPTLSDAERLKLIVRLRERGHTYAKIGYYVGMTPNGVMMALRRTQSPETYYKKLDEEVDDIV